MKLIERKKETNEVESFIFEPSEPVTWKAGQFLHWVLHHEPTDDRGSDRWFTVSAAPYEGHVMLTTRFLADGVEGRQSSFKKALAALEVGSVAMEVSDVDGEFVIEDPAGQYVFIAGGIGVTPFRAILEDLSHAGADIQVILLYANRDDEFAYKAELDALAGKHSGLKIEYLAGVKLDAAKIQELVPDLASRSVYVSGPEPMVEAMHAELEGMGIPKERIRGDWFPGYPAD